ncbi:hypothetical protein ACOMHN_062585 [Nucella lapillus]
MHGPAHVEKIQGGVAIHVVDVQTTLFISMGGRKIVMPDIDEITVTYPTIYELMYDLKGMGESNCSWSRKLILHRDTMAAAAAIYQTMYGNDRGVPATFQVINFIGWKPDPTQPRAAERGSGEVSLKDLDKVDQLTKQIKDLRGDGDKGDAEVEKMDKLAKELEDVTTKYTDPELPKGKK